MQPNPWQTICSKTMPNTCRNKFQETLRGLLFCSQQPSLLHRMVYFPEKEYAMEEFLICLDPATARFYDRIAQTAELTTEQVLQDALFKLAGELSLEAISKASR